MNEPYGYALIKRCIAIIDQAENSLSLEELSHEIGVSKFHLQKTFTKWVGISPKKYQQYLSLSHAKFLLKNRFTTLETSHAIGLSGTSRLHDLFITWEAMTPGQYAKHAQGLIINYGWYNSPFGKMLTMGTHLGLCGLAFCDEMGKDRAYFDMVSRWPKAEFQHNPNAIDKWALPITEFSGNSKLHIIGAPFQLQVWQALLGIPSGYVTSYSEIATAIGSPKAMRAVGTAVGRNPISMLIPCHRVIRKTGELGGYHWGLNIKRSMLAHETAKLEDD